MISFQFYMGLVAHSIMSANYQYKASKIPREFRPKKAKPPSRPLSSLFHPIKYLDLTSHTLSRIKKKKKTIVQYFLSRIFPTTKHNNLGENHVAHSKHPRRSTKQRLRPLLRGHLGSVPLVTRSNPGESGVLEHQNRLEGDFPGSRVPGRSAGADQGRRQGRGRRREVAPDHRREENPEGRQRRNVAPDGAQQREVPEAVQAAGEREDGSGQGFN